MLPNDREAILKVTAVEILRFIEAHIMTGTGFMGTKSPFNLKHSSNKGTKTQKKGV